MLLKKSTLCWFFQNSKEKLSSDRLLRVRGPEKERLAKSKVTAKPARKVLKKNMERTTS